MELTRRSSLGAVLSAMASPDLAMGGPAPRPLAAPDPISLVPNLFTRVATRVRINGRGPFLFVIDTGASRTCVCDIVVEALGLPLSEEIVVHGITTATRTASVRLDQLSIQGLSFAHVQAPVLPFDQVGAHGLIGLDLLADFGLDFNVANRTVALNPGGGVALVTSAHASRAGRPNVVRSRRGAHGQLILTETSIDGGPVVAFIDTGAQYSIANRVVLDAISGRGRDRLKQRRGVPIFGVTGQSIDGEVAEVGALRLGRASLGPTPLLFADLYCFHTLNLADRPALVIGADLISRFRRVTVDFARNEVAFDGLRRISPSQAAARLLGAG